MCGNRGIIFGRFRRNQCNNRVVFPCRRRIFQRRSNTYCSNTSNNSNSVTIDNFSSIARISPQSLEPTSARAVRELNAVCDVLNSLEKYHGTIRGSDARSGKRGTPEAIWTSLKKEADMLHRELSTLYTEEQQLQRIDSFKKKLLDSINSIASQNHKTSKEIAARIDFARSDLLRNNLSEYQYDEKQALTERLAQFEEIAQEATRALPQISDTENRQKWTSRIRSTVDKVNNLLSADISHQSIIELEQILSKELSVGGSNNGIISLAKWRNEHGAINIARGDGNRFFVEIPKKDFNENSTVYIYSPERSASLITGGPSTSARFFTGTHRTGTTITIKASRNNTGGYVSARYSLPTDLQPQDISISKENVSFITSTPVGSTTVGDTTIAPEFSNTELAPKPTSETTEHSNAQVHTDPQEDPGTQQNNGSNPLGSHQEKVQVLDPFGLKDSTPRTTKISPGENLFPSKLDEIPEPSFLPPESIPEPSLNPSGDTIPEPSLHPSGDIPEPTLYPPESIPEPSLSPPSGSSSSWSPNERNQSDSNLEYVFTRRQEALLSRRNEENQRQELAWKQYLEMLEELENNSTVEQTLSDKQAIA